MGKVRIIKREENFYPERLKSLKDSPPSLHYKGNLNKEIFENTLAVVGSRRMTSYGKRVTENLVRDLAEEGITIVSGFMYGVDATAHKAALVVNGKTIAVMPCGVNVIHPSYQEKLYREVEEKGLILSEFEDAFPSDKWTYPKRNRIVVGISAATLVIEAAKGSGSLISANLANKYNRKLFAVPGPIFNKNSEGTSNLLKEGATPVTSALDVLSFFKKRGVLLKKKEESLNKEEKIILGTLKEEPKEADEIARKTNLSVSRVNPSLSVLELKNLIKKEGRKYYPL